MLELTALQKKYGQQPVLDIPRLQLPEGLYWLKGANGSGKSTLMNIIAGLLPFKGDIVLDDRLSIRRQPVAYRAAINHSPAEPVFPSFLTGDELIGFVLRLKKGNAQQVALLKNVLGITQYTANPTGSYSSGMLKKLSLLLAFLGEPRLILLDEPFTTLDQPTQSALQELIQGEKGKGISFILTSHHDVDDHSLSFSQVFTISNTHLLQNTEV